MNRSYLSDKLEARNIGEKGGGGVFAVAPIAERELLCVWGGNIYTRAQFDQLPKSNQIHGIQVDENLFQTYAAGETADPADYFNHSCDPNAGLRGAISLVAMRDIAAGEEVCFDYAMSDGEPYDEFDCGCETAVCRTKITGNDWQLPDLQARYAAYFSPYLQERIKQAG